MFRFCFVAAVIGSFAAHSFGDTPKDTKPEETLALLLNAKGEIVREGKEPLKDPKEIKEYIEAEAKALLKRVGEKAIVVLRADVMVEFKHVAEVLQMCRDAGIKDVQLRATTIKGKK